MKKSLQGIWVLGLLLVLSACSEPAAPALAPASVGFLSVTNSASGDVQSTGSYDWSIEKSVDATEATLAQGGSATFEYTVEAKRTGSISTAYEVQGDICVTSIAPTPLSGVILGAELRYTDAEGAHTLPASVEDDDDGLAGSVTLPQGETCFQYAISGEDYQDDVTYQSHATVTFNGDTVSAEFAPIEFESLSDAVTNETAGLSDILTCPEGFTCTADTAFRGTWELTDSQTITYNVTVTNDGAACGQYVTLQNTATLTPSDAGSAKTARATVTIYTGECGQAGGEGCTPGYWRQPQHYDSWTGYLPSDSFEDVFDVDVTLEAKTGRKGPAETLSAPSLGQAVLAQGGDVDALARHGVAALLNAASAGVDYAYTTEAVIVMVHDAITGAGAYSIAEAKDLLAEQNEMGCPLN